MVTEQTKQQSINESQKERKDFLQQVNLKDMGRKKKRLQMTEKSEREKCLSGFKPTTSITGCALDRGATAVTNSFEY